MRKLDHCNIVRLRYFFYSSGEKVCVRQFRKSASTPRQLHGRVRTHTALNHRHVSHKPAVVIVAECARLKEIREMKSEYSDLVDSVFA